MKKIATFAVQWFMSHREAVQSKKGKLIIGGVAVGLLAVMLIPVPYPVHGSCSLETLRTHVVRAFTQGTIRKFTVNDGDLIKPGETIVELENQSIETDQKITEIAVEKLNVRLKESMIDNSPDQLGVVREIAAKEESLKQAKGKVERLVVRAPQEIEGLAAVSCVDQVRKVNTIVQEGDEICRIDSLGQLRAVVEIPEHQVRFIQIGNNVKFKLNSTPFETYSGSVSRISDLGKPDPVNPKAKLYSAEIIVDNPGELRPGMTGVAKIVTANVPVIGYIGRRLAGFFRLDLFF